MGSEGLALTSEIVGGALSAMGFDHVEVPAGADGGPRKQLTKHEFEALPLEKRVALLIRGSLRFFRGGREVTASEAMRTAG